MKPSFLLTAGQRKRERYSRVEDILSRYADVYASRFVWDGGPDGLPEGWIERSLFWSGCVGAKEVGGMGVILPAGPVKRDVYGWPITWVPSHIYGTQTDIGLFSESDGPCLFLGFEGLADEIRPYAEVIAACLRSLRTNVTAMRTPVLLRGIPGAELNAMIKQASLEDGDCYIPTVDGVASTMAEAIDLRVSDHTQALVNTIRAMDAEIMTRMSIMNAGVGRESGVTVLETGSISQLLTLQMSEEERVRERWRDEVNDRFKWDLSFKKSFEGWNDDRQNTETADPVSDMLGSSTQ